MSEEQTSIWESWAKSSPVWQHQNLMSRSLPDGNEVSHYAVDLAATISRYITLDLLGVKMKSSQAKDSWSRLSPVISFVLAMRQLAVVSQRECVVSPANAQYLTLQIDLLVPGLGGMIARDVSRNNAQDSEVMAGITRIVTSIVENAGGRFGRKAKDSIVRFMAISSEVEGGFAALLALWPFVSASDPSEILKPLIGLD